MKKEIKFVFLAIIIILIILIIIKVYGKKETEIQDNNDDIRIEILQNKIRDLEKITEEQEVKISNIDALNNTQQTQIVSLINNSQTSSSEITTVTVPQDILVAASTWTDIPFESNYDPTYGIWSSGDFRIDTEGTYTIGFRSTLRANGSLGTNITQSLNRILITLNGQTQASYFVRDYGTVAGVGVYRLLNVHTLVVTSADLPTWIDFQGYINGSNAEIVSDTYAWIQKY